MEKDLEKNYLEKYPNLEKSLRDGAKIHIFCSGGSLRVVRVEKNKELISYGEHPYLAGALAHAEGDFGLSYEEQYLGDNPRHTHYWTGAHAIATDLFDMYVSCGYTFDIFYSERWDKVVCSTPTPDRINRENEILWGTADDIMYAMCSCLLSFNFEDKDLFMGRASS